MISGRRLRREFGPPYRRDVLGPGRRGEPRRARHGEGGAGQALATEEALARSRTRFETPARRPFILKGKAKPVRAFEIGPVIAAGSGSGTSCGWSVARRRWAHCSRRWRRRLEAAGGWSSWSASRGWASRGWSRSWSRTRASIAMLVAVCEHYETSSPYRPIRRTAAGPARAAGSTKTRGAAHRLRDRVAATAPHLVPWLPLLGVPVDIELPKTPQTARLEEGFRRRRLEAVGGGAARVTTADADAVHVRGRALDGRGLGRTARADRREGRRILPWLTWSPAVSPRTGSRSPRVWTPSH